MAALKELSRVSWQPPAAVPAACGPYGDHPRPRDEEKREVWRAYRAGTPTRVPVTLGINNRVMLQVPDLNPDRLTYREVFTDPTAMLLAQLRTQQYIRSCLGWFHDTETSIPHAWRVGAHYQNISEAAFFGCPLQFREGEVPDTLPAYSGDARNAVFDVDIDRPTEKGFFADGIRMTHRMEEVARTSCFLGVPIVVEPYLPLGTDGPLTDAMNLCGPGILTDLVDHPSYASQLFDLIVTAAYKRNREMRAYWGVEEKPGEEVGLADDSISLLGHQMYRAALLPWHRAWYDRVDAQRNRKRAIHLCGDAQRHFATIHRELGVTSFDTGFPVDFPRLREELGPGVEILGGVEVVTLLGGTPQEVFERARGILESGILHGGRFILREGNNLPPGVPWSNLAAMYAAAFRYGSYG